MVGSVDEWSWKSALWSWSSKMSGGEAEVGRERSSLGADLKAGVIGLASIGLCLDVVVVICYAMEVGCELEYNEVEQLKRI